MRGAGGLAVRLFQRNHRPTWWVEFRDPVTGKEVRRSLRVTNKRAAEGMVRDLTEQVARRHHRLPTRQPWNDAVEAYLGYGQVYKAAATVVEDRLTLTKRVRLPAIVRYVDDVRTEHIEGYVGGRIGARISASRINRELRTLRAFFNWCAKPSRRWIAENPAREVRQLPEPQGMAARAMEDDILQRLFTETRGTRIEGIVLLAANHGLREGEIIHIRRDAVDVARGTIWIRHDPLSEWTVKGGEERIVHLNEVTLDWVRRHLLEPARDLCPYLFSMKPGKPWTRESLVMAVGRVMRRIGIPRGGLHMLRHTWATLHAEAGTPIPVLKAMGGWRDWRSMDRYQHIGDQAQRDASARVVLGRRTGKVVPLRAGGVQPRTLLSSAER